MPINILLFYDIVCIKEGYSKRGFFSRLGAGRRYGGTYLWRVDAITAWIQGVGNQVVALQYKMLSQGKQRRRFRKTVVWEYHQAELV
jgi:hypothetical protein